MILLVVIWLQNSSHIKPISLFFTITSQHDFGKPNMLIRWILCWAMKWSQLFSLFYGVLFSQMVVSVVRSRAMEKQKLKPSPLRDDFSWTDSPATRELYVTMASPQPRVVIGDGEDDEREEFFSVKSCLSCCSSNAVSEQPFFSVKTNLSRCSSMSGVDMSEHWRRSIIQEFCHCQGWPFGLCRKAVLLPPLPKSPSESWLSRKIQRSTKVIWSYYTCSVFSVLVISSVLVREVSWRWWNNGYIAQATYRLCLVLTYTRTEINKLLHNCVTLDSLIWQEWHDLWLHTGWIDQI